MQLHAVVLQQYEAFGGYLPGGVAVLFRKDVAPGAFRVAVFIWVVEQAELVLRFEDAAAGGVEGLHRHLSALDGFLEGAYEAFAHHVHIDAGIEGAGGDGLKVADAMLHHFGYSREVGDDEAPEAPRTAQDVGHQPAVGGGGHAVHFVERCHHTAYSCLDGSFIRIHVFVEHAVAAHVYGVVVASRFSGAVEGEVLDAGHDFVVALQLLRDVIALIAQHHGAGDGTPQEGIFARAFGDTSPTRVTADVDHRAERPRDAVC